jgi:hypothetical protein
VLVGGRSMRAKNGTRTAVAAIVAALLVIFAAAAYADVAPGTDFRVSNVGVDGDTRPGAFNPDVAYNSTDNNYLIVWYGDGDFTFDYEIYGQLVDANGNQIGSDFQISQADGQGIPQRIALDPAVSYDSTNDQYLVIWYADQGQTDNEYEVWGQVLSATGAEVGSDFRISNVGTDGSISRTALRAPEVTYNPVANEYLAIWSGNNLPLFSKYEIWGQRVSAAGAEVGSDFRISNMGADTDPARGADKPVVAANSQTGDYMVAWYGNPLGAAGEYEIYGQVLNSAGAEVGTDVRVSNVGTDGDGLREPGPEPPAIAYDSVDNQYLVTWYGNNLTNKDEYEVWGQRLDATGGQVPDTTDFRISNVGTDGDSTTGAFNPSVSYDSVDNQYLVAWYGNIGAEVEICGQKLSGTGADVGGDIRLSNMGPEGDSSRGAFFPATTYNPQTNEYLATWYGDDATDNEFEVYARRVGTSNFACSSLPAPEITSLGQSSRHVTAGWTLPAGRLTGAIEVATAPDTDVDGFFLPQNTVLYQEYLDSTTSYSSAEQLPPGTYYVHVSAYDPLSPACAADPLALDCVWVFSSPPAVLTIPSNPTTPPPPAPVVPPPPVVPSKVIKLTVSAASTQKALKAKAIMLRASCDQACSLNASARLSVPGASKTYKARSVKRSLAAGKSVTLKLKLSAKTIRAAKAALRRHKKVRATVNLTALGPGGSTRSTKRISIKG